MATPPVDVPALLKRLRLATVARLLADYEARAAKEGWSHREFLALLLAEEVAHRADTRVHKLVRHAHFPYVKTIEEFDFVFQSNLRRQQLGPYLGPEFVSEGRNLILSGKPGRGKTHLAVALAYKAIQNGFEARFVNAAHLVDELHAAARAGTLRDATASYVQPHVLVIDEVGYLQCASDAANVLYGVVDQRCLRRRPMVFTTNKALKRWGDVLHDQELAEALLDRVLERGEHIRLGGRSFRTRAMDPKTLEEDEG
ncbi:MAG: IS21-like element helper ATPase IstB [Polyangiaceae bacterium]